jgi:hypothetical protein
LGWLWRIAFSMSMSCFSSLPPTFVLIVSKPLSAYDKANKPAFLGEHIGIYKPQFKFVEVYQSGVMRFKSRTKKLTFITDGHKFHKKLRGVTHCNVSDHTITTAPKSRQSGMPPLFATASKMAISNPARTCLSTQRLAI